MVHTERPTPKSLGYTFPDEWGEHAGTAMIFPAKHSYGLRTRGLQREFREIALAIAKNEPVQVYAFYRDERRCRELLGGETNITIRVGDYRIDWARDNAPMILKNGRGDVATAGFRFNGWGKKYRGWQDDAETRDKIARSMEYSVFSSDFVLEGGSIEIADRVGIVTESCVLHKNRTDWEKSRVEEELKKMLGLERIIWLKSGLMPDPVTDGHVDGMLKWVGSNTVLLHTTDYQKDVNYQICQDAKAVLEKEGIKVIELPLMKDMEHMNFYIGSGGKVAYVPVCGDPKQDGPPLNVIRGLFEEVVPLGAKALRKAGGGIHCYTMQIPK